MIKSITLMTSPVGKRMEICLSAGKFGFSWQWMIVSSKSKTKVFLSRN